MFPLPCSICGTVAPSSPTLCTGADERGGEEVGGAGKVEASGFKLSKKNVKSFTSTSVHLVRPQKQLGVGGHFDRPLFFTCYAV